MRFQKKKVNEAIANPEGATDKKSPLITRIQKKIANKQVENAQKRLGEDIDSFDTSNPQIARLNTRITQLKSKLSKKNDANIKRQAIALIAQKERLEAQAAKNQMRTSGKKEDQKSTEQTATLQNASYEPEGELVDEARAEEKRGLKSTGTQRQKQKTGVVTSSGEVAHPATSYSGGQNPQLRGKSGRTKEQRRAASRRYVDQPGGIYAEPENLQGAERFTIMQRKKRGEDIGSRFD